MEPTRRHLLTAGGLGVSLLVPAAAEGHGVRHAGFAWPQGRTAAVSLTYDDGLDSQLDNVLPALGRRGLKATFFLTAENVAARVDEWRAVAAQGHEIADHTYHHTCALGGYGADQFAREELEPTERYLDAHFGPGMRLFAYPCGVIELGPGGQLAGELRYIEQLRHRFLGARAADGDPNDPRRVRRERFQLQAIAPTFERDDPHLAIAYLQKALRWRRWAILVFHNVLESRLAEGDTSIASHDLILDHILANDFWCAPMGEVFAHCV